MSDTGDTDDLLLIPPDFFLEQSEPEPPYYNIVDSLIKQVSNLQDRIEGIESMSDVSLVGSYIDNLYDSRKYSRMLKSKNASAKKYYSYDDLYQPGSNQSTPQKPNEKFRLNSLPNTPVANRFSSKKNNVKFIAPQKEFSSLASARSEDPSVLQEIDSFISNVKTIQRNQAFRSLENDFNNVKNNGNEHEFTYKHSDQSSKKEVDSSHIFERNSERRTTTTINDCQKERIDCINAIQDRVERVNAWQCGDLASSVPDYGSGAKDSLYKTKDTRELPIQPSYVKACHQIPVSTTTDFNSSNTVMDSSSESSSESTQMTAYKHQGDFSQKLNQRPNHRKDGNYKELYRKGNRDNVRSGKGDLNPADQGRSELLHSPLHDNALSVLDMHKRLMENPNINVEDREVPKQRGINTLSDNLGFLSLAEIWGPGQLTKGPGKLSMKLQEEKLRRQHCEHLIQELQSRNLELQQKIAVAVRVDATKTQNIQQLKEALSTISLRMERLAEEKLSWDRELNKISNQHALELESVNQKIQQYERESAKSLTVIRSNQEKISFLENRCSDLQNELKNIEIKFREVQENYENEVEKSKHLADIISQKEIELKENRNVLSTAREEVSHSRKAVEVCQAEFTSLKSECSKLQSELDENKNTITSLNDQKARLLNDIQIYKHNEKTLKDTLEQSKQKLVNTKVELRNFYQGQLEIIVENKRKEMQSQLEHERQNSLEEMKRKELSMAKTAANHIKEISDKCALETKLLEQKHQEEIRLYKMQLSQSKREIESLQAKMANLPEKRAQIAKQLQKVMESQWNEALKMINSSPPTPVNEQQDIPLKQHFQALSEDYNPKAYKQQESGFDTPTDYDETPVSSRGNKQSESEVQKYINMLLHRQPGNPIKEAQDSRAVENHQRSTWHPGDQENQSEIANARQSRDRKTGKPPWK